MIELGTDREALQALGRALKDEEDGKKLRRELAANMRAALAPAMGDVRTSLMGMSTGGLPTAGPPLRTTVLRGMRAEARLSGRSTGARLKIKKTPGVRGFANAAKRLGRAKGWRVRLFGREEWRHQVGEVGYFDRNTVERVAEYRAAVMAAAESMARRIAARARRR